MDSFLRTLRTPAGALLEPCFRVAGDHMLVTLNDDAPLPSAPPFLAGRTAACKWNGMLTDWEWTVRADFNRATAPHRAYMPRADGQFFTNGHRDWVFAWNVAMETTNAAPYRCLSADATRIRMASEEAWSWAALVCNAYPGLDAWRPVQANLAGLTALFSTRPEFNAAVWVMRRSVLELYGFVAATLLNSREWEQRSWPTSFVEKIHEAKILTGPKRGVVLDLTELNEGTVRRYVAHGVPVQYRWRYRPPPTGSIMVYSPVGIGAFDFEERQASAQSAVVANRKAKRSAGCANAGREAQSGVGKKAKKKWYKLVDGEGQRISISATEAKRLAEDWKVDTSESTEAGEVAIVHEGVPWEDNDDNEDDLSRYMAPAPALPDVKSVERPRLPPSVADDPSEWPALMPTEPTTAKSDPMDVDEDSVSLGDEEEDALSRADLIDTNPMEVEAPRSPSARQATESEQRPLRRESAHGSPITPSARRVLVVRENRERTPPPQSMGNHSRHDRRRGRTERSHSVSGEYKRDNGWPGRFRPYTSALPSRPRTRSRSGERERAWSSSQSGSWPSRPRTPSPSPPTIEIVQAPPQTEQPPVEEGQSAQTPAKDVATEFDIHALESEEARRLLVENLSATSAHQLLEVLLRQVGGEMDGLLQVLSSPDGVPHNGSPLDNDSEALPGSIAARLRNAVRPTPTPGASLPTTVWQAAGPRLLLDRLSMAPGMPSHHVDPLISRLGLPLEMRIMSAPEDSSLMARLGQGDAPRRALVDGARMACAAWIRQALQHNGNNVFDTTPFSGNASVIAPPSRSPDPGTRISWEPRTALRVDRWMMEEAVRNVREAAAKAFALGCAYKVWSPAPTQWHPSTGRQPWFPALPCLPHAARETFFSQTALLQYVANVTAVLSRPHARGALMAGGFLWRIALEWGPRWLVDDLWRAADPEGGLVEYDSATHSIAYALSTDEVNALLGVATGSANNGVPQLWPPLDQVDRSVWSVGQWTPGNEAWFVNRARLIRSHAPNITAHTKSTWKGTVRVRSHQKQASADEPGTAAEAEYLLRQAREAYPLAYDGLEVFSMND
ncbi:hypothetical protein C8R47DRAFT_1083370 [Mycena vitilis]|nr:hypothetical protein C8R47DRAFT_1083370 [Mycena vitilis]